MKSGPSFLKTLTPIKLGLIGHGKMGKTVERVAQEKGFEISSLEDAQVLIDFSHPNAIFNTLNRAISLKKNLVIGTTGWQENLTEVKKIVEDNDLGVLFAPNFSIGVYLFIKAVEASCKLFSDKGYDVAGFEMHHREKVDAPSGTGLSIEQAILNNFSGKTLGEHDRVQGKIDSQVLHFPSIRVGHLAGTHKVIFDSLSDTVTLTHESKGRSSFAEGAIFSACWLYQKKGFFTLEECFK